MVYKPSTKPVPMGLYSIFVARWMYTRLWYKTSIACLYMPLMAFLRDRTKQKKPTKNKVKKMVMISECKDVFSGLESLYVMDAYKEKALWNIENYGIFVRQAKSIGRSRSGITGLKVYEGVYRYGTDDYYYFSYCTKNYRYFPRIEDKIREMKEKGLTRIY